MSTQTKRRTRRGFARMIQDPSVPVIGDLLRVAFHASRFHPDPDVRAALGDSLDRMLDTVGAPRHSFAEIAAIFAKNPGTPLAPMVADADDAALATRLWRYCDFAHIGAARLPGVPHPPTSVLVTSADAVGTAHGVLLAERKPSASEEALNAAYLPRRRSPGPELPRLHLAMARRSTGIAAPACGDVATLASDPASGIAIEVQLANRPGDLPCLAKGSWLMPLGQSTGRKDAPSLGSLAIKVEMPSARRIRILPETPEGAIRLTVACADRAVMHVPIALMEAGQPQRSLDWLRPGAFDILIRLAPVEDTAIRLPCVRYSRTGLLADWIRFPRLPLGPDLAPELRAAIAAHYTST